MIRRPWLTTTEHRPRPLPDRPWTMLHTWHDLLFMHWPVPVDAFRPHVPRAVEIDTYDGQAWVAVVPFRLSGIRLRGFPPLPWVSMFAEVNVRTYVTYRGQPGVWFLSLDANSRFNVYMARAWYRLRYFHAAIACGRRDDSVGFSSRRIHAPVRPAELRSRYRPTGQVSRSQPGSLEHWLTERYCLYTADRHGRLFCAEIHHEPWPLRAAEVETEANTLAAAAGIDIPDVPPLLHFADPIDVAVWSPQRVTP